MSYDLTFVPKTAEQSWEEALAAAEEDSSAGPEDAVWARLELDLREILGDISVSHGGSYVEADHEGTGIQVNLYGREAAITVPYWHRGADAAQVVTTVYRIAAAIEKHTGLHGYDQQVERPTAEAQPAEAIACFEQVARSFAQRRRV